MVYIIIANQIYLGICMTNVYIFHQHFFLLQVQNVDHQIWKQTFLIVIVVVRWILPKGGLSHDELSNLLFIYFASASDIMELSSFEIFDTDSFCRVGNGIFYGILVVWSLSLLQFTVPLSAKVSPGDRHTSCLSKNWEWFYGTEIWSILLTVLLTGHRCLGAMPFNNSRV